MAPLFQRRSREPVLLAGRVYGVGLSIEVSDPATAELVNIFLPPVWEAADPEPGTISFKLSREPDRGLRLYLNGDEVITGEQERVLEVFDRYMRNHIARSAQEHVFLHAGVVVHAGKAIVIPGSSFSGKTTLVTALVRAGASYYSDEYAVFDAEGNVLPFQKPLAIRLTEGDSRQTQHHVSEIGGRQGSEPARVGVVALLQYRNGAEWDPVELSQAAAVVEMLAHTYQSVDRPALSLSVLRKAVSGATAVKGERGEADASVKALFDYLPA